MDDFGFPSDWAQTLIDPQAFAHEQRCLAYVWTFLGFTKDVAKDGEWFRASLATRSVFVQRFGAELKGFENICAHRFYPLRTAEKGAGPIVCGHHHWRYDREGCAVGIPMCEEQFGAVSRALGARLNPIEVETCGTFVFGRFPAPRKRESLKEFLGIGFPILDSLSRLGREPQSVLGSVEANWKLCLQITLDDYHNAAVHPTTFSEGYLRRADINYARFGLHSAFFNTKTTEALERMSSACAGGSFRPTSYCIFQILPTFVVSLARSDAGFFFCCIQQFVPLTHGRSAWRAWIYPAPFPAGYAWHVRLIRLLSDPIRMRLVLHRVRQIFQEDNKVCENLQEVAHQIEKAPLLAALEERIGWFEHSYRQLISAGEEAQRGIAGEAKSSAV